MADVFLIMGYAVPQDIHDQNGFFYQYVKAAYKWVASKVKAEDVIVFCGGNTDCFRPYTRIVADEMLRLFQYIDYRKLKVPDENYLLEKKSISTLENLVFVKNILRMKEIDFDNLFIFCTNSRIERVRVLAQQIFNKPVEITAIDDKISLWKKAKEKKALSRDLHSLRDEAFFAQQHQYYENKWRLLRLFNDLKNAWNLNS